MKFTKEQSLAVIREVLGSVDEKNGYKTGDASRFRHEVLGLDESYLSEKVVGGTLTACIKLGYELAGIPGATIVALGLFEQGIRAGLKLAETVASDDALKTREVGA